MAGIPFVIDLSSLDGLNGFEIYGSAFQELSGSSVASAGDVNGDGIADIIVGARGVPFSYYTPADYAAYVVFGAGAESAPRVPSIDTADLAPSQGFRIAHSKLRHALD